MKRIVFTLLLGVMASTSAFAQAKLSVERERLSVGLIEWKQPATAHYVVTNTGNAPLQLTEVDPDCACTTVKWPQGPIAPGEKRRVSITFDAKQLGHFDKQIALYSNANARPVWLHMQGEVVMEIKDFSLTHPYLFDQVRLDKHSVEFPDLQRGEQATLRISVVNLSDHYYAPVLMHLPPYVEAVATPNVLKKGERGFITLTLNSERLPDLGLTQRSVYLARYEGDKVCEETEIPLSAVLLPDFSDLTPQQRADAPVVSVSDSELDFSERLLKKNKVRQTVVVTNRGKSDLSISKLQVFNPAIAVSLKKSVLKPGESAKLKVTLHKKHINPRRPMRLLMITNDPYQPKVELEIKY